MPLGLYRVRDRRAALDDPPTHGWNVVDGSAADNDPRWEGAALARCRNGL